MSKSSNPDAGNMPECTRTFDWSKTPLGPIANWPAELKIAVARTLAPAEELTQAEAGTTRDATGRVDGYVGINTDISERKRAQQDLQRANETLARHVEQQSAALRSSEQRYRDLVEQAVDGIFVTDLTGRLLDANSSATKMFGRGLEELRELRFRDLIVPAEVARIPAEFTQLGSGGVVTSQWQLRRRDGSTFPGEIVAQRLDGGRLLAILRDITARRQAEDALRESELRFRKVFEGVATGIAITDLQGRFELSNPAYSRLVGWSAQELHRTDFSRLVHAEDRVANLAEFHRLAAGEIGQFELENRLMRKDGELRWVHKFISALPDETGRPAHLVCLVTDVTERKRAEEALHELNATLEQRVAERTAALQASEERQRAILDTVVDAIVTADEHGTIVAANPATERICGWTTAELIGQNLNVLVPAAYREQHDQHLEEYRRTGIARIIGSRREVQAQRKDGGVFPIELAIGKVQRLGLVTCVIRDLTERKRLEADVLDIGEDERRRLAAELHDGVCQELAGLGYRVGALLQGREPIGPAPAKELENIAEAIFQVAQHTRQVAHAMNPLIAAGDGLMLGLRQLAATTSRRCAVQCLFNCPAPVQVAQLTVAFQLYRVAQEAVHNAIQHGDAKRITVRLSQREGALCLEIVDSGTGVSAEAVDAPGMGIRTMKYRVGLIGGQFTIERRRRGGTSVRCVVPTVLKRGDLAGQADTQAVQPRQTARPGAKARRRSTTGSRAGPAP